VLICTLEILLFQSINHTICVCALLR